MTDGRSSLAFKIINVNPHAYEALVFRGSTPELAREKLEGIQPENLLEAPTTSSIAAYAMLAGLWLWHDGLSECHEIVQKSPEDLLAAALNLHSKPSKTSPKVPSVQNVGNDKPRHPEDLREMASTLAYWHAIMHRREGNFSNSKYWYARAAGHPALATLAGLAVPMVNAMPADRLLLRMVARGFDPNALVDLVEEVYEREDDPRRGAAVQLQQLEWRALFDFCARG
jgi:hypothetical protein